MKFGFRIPSIKRRVKARISIKRQIRAKVHVPKGVGIITNPKRAIYNKIYKRTSFDLFKLFTQK